MTYTREDNSSPMPGPRRPALRRVRPKFAGLSRSAVALFRVGTYRARMAAALMIVAGSLLYQTGADALEQSSKKVLYLDAPSVSVPQAEKAGETARGYAGPDSNVDDAVLAWVDVKPVPLEARKAFASITDPSGQAPGGVSYDDAVAAGDAMVAQLGGDSPAPSAGEDDELASADPVRPKLGDGTKATDTPGPGGADQQSGATGTGSQQPEYAAADSPAPSDLGLPAPMAEEYAPEPSTEQPAEQPPDSNGSELAAVPEDASEGMEEGIGGNSDTGPTSDDYAAEVASPNPSDGSADEAAPQDETESGSSGVGEPDLQGDEVSSPTIIVPGSLTSGDEPEQEYAGVPDGSGTEPETSETPESETETSDPENTATPQDEPSDEIPDEASSDPSSEPSPASTAEESVPAQDTSPGTNEQEPEESSDLVAVVPYDPGTEEGQDESQEGLEQSSQPSAEPTAEPSSGPSTDETESYSPEPEPGQQEELPGQAAATPLPEEQEATGEDPALQPETESNAELGAGEDTEDTVTEEELPEGVQVESSDEPGVQKLSVVVHQESESTNTPVDNSSEAQGPPEPSETKPSETEQPSPAPQEEAGLPSTAPDANTGPEAERVTKSNNAGEPDSDQSDDAPEPGPEESAAGDHNAGDDSPAPQEAPGDQQQPAPKVSPEPSAGADQVQPETTVDPTAGNEATEPETTPANQGRQGDQRAGEERVLSQEPRTSTPNSASAPKDQAPRPNTEGAGRGPQGNDQGKEPTQSRDGNQDKQQSPQPEQQQPSQPAREPRQSTAPAKASPAKVSPVEQGEDTGVQGPIQSADAVPISAQTEPRTEPQAEPVPAQDSQPPAPTAATNTLQSNEAAPAPQNQPVVTAEPVSEPVVQPPAASQTAPEVTPETAPAVQPAVQTSVDPATEEVADPAGWEDPTQAAAAGQTIRQANQAANQAAGQVFTQLIDAATQSYAVPAVEQGWDQAAQQVADSVQGQGAVDTGVPVQAYPAQGDGTQVSEVVDAVNQVNQVDSYTQGTVVDPYSEPSVEPATSSYEAPAVQDATGAVEGVVQEGYAQDAADPYVEDVAANAIPASQPVPEPVTSGGAVDSISYDAPATLPETYEAPAPAETYTEPITQVPAQQLEPVQQVPTQELAPAPQAANVLANEPAAAQPSVAPTGLASPAPASAAPKASAG